MGLTRYAKLTGQGGLVQSDVMSEYLEFLYSLKKYMPFQAYGMPVGISISRPDDLEYMGLQHHVTIDYTYPIVDNIYMMGKIAGAHMLGELYARGLSVCDKMMMQVSMPASWEYCVFSSLLVRGYKDCAKNAGAQWAGNRHFRWPTSCIIGGIASTHCQPKEYISPDKAVAGDVLLLTKALGIQEVLNAHECMKKKSERCAQWLRLSQIVSEDEVRAAFLQAMRSMVRLNRVAARLMHKHNAHGAAHIGFLGLLAYAQSLVAVQKQAVSFVIDTLPVIGKMAAVAKANANANGDKCPLLQGLSAETSGGLLICMPREDAVAFCKDIKREDDYPAWIIGRVESGNRKATITENPSVIDVYFP
ncbi:inactive selenide, water dikinase-like protein [Drosophila obscura]|uniref:inactive selenide, water dikinase-like protein n=1 Tax=Drosophila obscura TaxID=7282 RepID=UPI001BB0DC83|nr:inactive selenide, water dikinase-like protein [Drosophila obscura]